MPVLDRPRIGRDVPPETPDIDDTIRHFLGEDYPDNLFLIYLPQRVSHLFASDDIHAGQWVVAFPHQETAWLYANGVSRHPRPNGWWQEPVQLHQHALPEACQIVQRVYEKAQGLLIFYTNGRRICHYVR